MRPLNIKKTDIKHDIDADFIKKRAKADYSYKNEQSSSSQIEFHE